ncbi:MAG: ABC transporter permease [Myxococcales bacterium]|nr:ABC transporter permease [Myxococcales bacterium]
MANSNHLRSALPVRQIPRFFLANIGAQLRWLVAYTVQIATFIGHALLRLTVGWRDVRPVTRSVLTRQVLFTAVEALPFTAMIAVLVGASVIVQAQMHLSGSPDMVSKLLVLVVVRELGPLVSAMILIGRSGTAMVVEMGNMQVSGQIDALDYAGIDPFEYLVVPRIFGMAASVVLVALFFLGVSVAAGLLAGGLLIAGDTGAGEFLNLLLRQLSWLDFVAFFAKTFVPGLMIAGVACYEGMAAGPHDTDVPRAATRGTVRAMSALFSWNVAVSAMLYLA